MTTPDRRAPGTGYRDDPDRWIAHLCRELRVEGLSCSVSESVLAAECARSLDERDPLDLLFGLRAAFCSAPPDLVTFDRCFWRLWRAEIPEEESTPAVAHRVASGPVPRIDAGAPPSGPEGHGDSGAEADAPPLGAAYSPLERIGRRSFATVGAHELGEFDDWIRRLVLRVSTRRSRRLEPGGRRGPVDLRRSARLAIRTDGEWVRLVRRRRRLQPPRIVILCDVSGSMERYSRFLVRFLLASGRAREIETFAFSTRLTHLTPRLARASLDDALAELRGRGWSRGTRIGDSLTTFVERHGRTMLGRRTTVIILSDGLDQGETEPLERAMGRIHRRARRVIWLNPLLESSRYAPEARGMRAALPYIDEFASGHSLAALARLASRLRL